MRSVLCQKIPPFLCPGVPEPPCGDDLHPRGEQDDHRRGEAEHPRRALRRPQPRQAAQGLVSLSLFITFAVFAPVCFHQGPSFLVENLQNRSTTVALKGPQ